LGEYIGTPRTLTTNNDIHNCYGSFDKRVRRMVLE
jgi:hypothetical protein